MKLIYKLLVLSISIAVLGACSGGKYIETFSVMDNFIQGDTLRADMQLDNSVFEGVVLPSKDEFFTFSARVKQKEGRQLFYKIYYQNESYKFENERAEANENFYGSWQETQIGFKPLQGSCVRDSFQIVGNPRNERLYFGSEKPGRITEEEIEKSKEIIRKDKNWLKSIEEKALTNKISVEEQLTLDVLWLKGFNAEQEGEINRRERRNPRTGAYKFMLVVADADALAALPEYIKDISKTNDKGEFVNPFAYFEDCDIEGIDVKIS
ncbi:MAG: hypothetical protein SO444_02725, partial [Candidatus Onthomorpha sp.]|nr:hypothetical protein [Candidatus Onthomorpha sp.]